MSAGAGPAACTQAAAPHGAPQTAGEIRGSLARQGCPYPAGGHGHL